MKRAIVTGAGGFIGNDLVGFLRERGYWVRGVDLKMPEWNESRADEFVLCDLRERSCAMQALAGSQSCEVYHLAADMGGIGYIGTHSAQILRNNMHIDLNVIDAVAEYGCQRLFYSSSACVYPLHLQQDPGAVPLLREGQAWPAQPEDGYGLEKLVIERALQYYHDARGLPVRVARFHNIYGANGTFEGGREKVPAALCRKVASSKLLGCRSIEVWGDGNQVRSFLHVDDCCDGIYRLTKSNVTDPVNLGTENGVSINHLLALVQSIAGTQLDVLHVNGVVGVKARSCDPGKAQELLGWKPSVTLQRGIERTYKWVEEQVREQLR